MSVFNNISSPTQAFKTQTSSEGRNTVKSRENTAYHRGPSLSLSACLVSLPGRRVSVLSGVSQCRQMRSHYASLPQG